MNNLYAFLITLGDIKSRQINIHLGDQGWKVGICPDNEFSHYNISTAFGTKNIEDTLLNNPKNLLITQYVWDEPT